MFCKPEEIKKTLIEVLDEMNGEFSNDMFSIREFAFKLARCYYELVYVHPFREGNGRTIRAFIRDFVVEKSKDMSCGPLDLDYTKMDKNNLLLGTVRRYIYPSMLEMEFMKGLVTIQKENKTQKK